MPARRSLSRSGHHRRFLRVHAVDGPPLGGRGLPAERAARHLQARGHAAGAGDGTRTRTSDRDAASVLDLRTGGPSASTGAAAIAGALEGTDLPLSRPDIARELVYIDDLVDLYLEAAERAGISPGVFNAGSGVLGTIGEVVDRVLRLTGSRARARWGTFQAPHHDDFPWVADPTRTFSRFAWRPRVALEEGLARTIAAAREGALR